MQIAPALRVLLLAVLAVVGTAEPLGAQELSVDLGDGGGETTQRLLQIILVVTVLSLAPSILVMVTSFTRIVVVLSFMRNALGIQQTPPNSVLISLALFLTVYIMMPTMQAIYDQALEPLMNDRIRTRTAVQKAADPLRSFMLKHVREQDLNLFLDMANIGEVEKAENTPLRALVPAFMISELRRAFEIGFLLYLPFLIIDMVVASVLMSMGMLMLPPVIISLPFKLIFFVLVDGWYLVAGSLVRSYGVGT